MKSGESSPIARKETDTIKVGNDMNTNNSETAGEDIILCTTSPFVVESASKLNSETGEMASISAPMLELPSEAFNKTKKSIKHHPISHNRPKVAKTSSNDVPSVQASNLNLIIERSNALCNRWNRLGLGEETGTKALNEFLKRRGVNKKNGKPYSTAQMVQMFDTLIPETVPLPPNSHISKMMQKAQFGKGFIIAHVDAKDDNTTDAATAGYRSSPPKDALAKVYELMTTQSSYLSIKKRKFHHLDGDEVVDRLKSFENRFCDLREKEEKLSKILSKHCSEP